MTQANKPTRKSPAAHRAAAASRAVSNSYGYAAAELPESLDIDAEIQRIQEAEAAEAAAAAAHLAEEAAALAAAAEERDRPGIERQGRLAALLASKASTAAKQEAAALAAAHEGVESVKEDAFAIAADAKNAATFGNGTPDFRAVVAAQLGACLGGVDIPPLVFTSTPSGHVNGTFWGLDFFARVTLDPMADVWTAEITASTRNADGSLRYMGDIASPLDLALLLAGSPRRSN